jgi:hypothetical protein
MRIKNIFKRVKFKSLRGYGGRWVQFVAGIVGGLVLVAIIFALPIKHIKTESVETYYVTEVRQEAYTETVPYTAEEVREYTRVIADGFYISVPQGITFPFTVDEPGARLVGSYDNPFTGTFKVTAFPNRIVWEKLGSRGVIDVMLEPGDYQAKFQENVMWGQDCRIYLALQWNEVQQVTHYRDVTMYRDVPVQVEKQRTITAQEKISLWKYLFS